MKKRWMCLLAALALTVGVAASPLTGDAAPLKADGDGKVVADGTCSMTVYPEDQNKPQEERFGEDLAQAGVVVDIYRVADAMKTEGQDACYFEPVDGYDLEIPAYPKAEDWVRLAQQAARTALGGNGAAEPVEQGMAVGTAITGLDTGLYLVIARGGALTDPKDYVTEIEQETDSQEREARLATMANSAQYTYLFAPQLISLPDRLTETAEDGTVTNMGDWNYEPVISLKPERAARYGSLEIVKTLLEHESMEGIQESVTCVFEVTGELEGELVYSEVESITFTEAGRESVVLDQIPALAQVTVREVYSGASYELTVPGDRSATIAADDVVSVEFENVYNGRQTNGHGIKNQFVQDESGAWLWHSDPTQEAKGNEGLPPVRTGIRPAEEER